MPDTPNTSSAHTAFMTSNNGFPKTPVEIKPSGFCDEGSSYKSRRGVVCMYYVHDVFNVVVPLLPTRPPTTASLPGVRIYSRQRARGREDCLFSLWRRNVFFAFLVHIATTTTTCFFHSTRPRPLGTEAAFMSPVSSCFYVFLGLISFRAIIVEWRIFSIFL